MLIEGVAGRELRNIYYLVSGGNFVRFVGRAQVFAADRYQPQGHLL